MQSIQWNIEVDLKKFKAAMRSSKWGDAPADDAVIRLPK
jgi:hypothetical protein